MPEAEPAEMEEKLPAESSVDTAEEEMEFRPWVKWCGVGLACAASIGVLLLTYSYSYKQGEKEGYDRAISSGMVHERLNQLAYGNVLSMARLSSASDEYLLSAAADTAKTFAWIKDAAVRQETEWILAETLLQRGFAESAVAVLSPLFEQVTHSTEWAYRALTAADALSSAYQYAAARQYYKFAAESFGKNEQQDARLKALTHMVALEVCEPRTPEAALKAWQELIDELQGAGAAARPLRDMLLVQMGELLRMRGNAAQAQKCYKSALQGVDLTQNRPLEYAVTYGAALVGTGDEDAAEPLLRRAESSTGNRPSEVMARLRALRLLAVLEQSQGQNATALSLLHRAQGVAEGRILPDNTFWPCLFDQRGWLHFLSQHYQTALLDFTAAISKTQDAFLLIQPLEGAARCHMELGQVDQAQPLLEKCLELRHQHAAADKSALGRINLLLGQIYDQQGKDAAAETAYGAAIANLTADTPEEVDNRRLALLGRAYALSELRRWQESYQTWEQLLPLLQEQNDRREEARNQMRRIKSYLPGEPNDAELTEHLEPDTPPTH